MMPVLVAMLVVLQDADAAVREFEAAFRKKGATVAEQVSAVEKLGEMRHETTSKALVKLLAAEERIGVAAAKSLANFTEVKGTAARVAPYLLERANAERTAVRVEIVRCLASLKDAAALPALHKELRGRDLFVAKEIVLALQAIRNRGSVPVMIDYLKICEKAPIGNVEIPFDFGPKTDKEREFEEQYPQWTFWVRVDADAYARLRKDLLHEPLVKALKSVTKQDWETHKGWHEWWQSSGPAFKVAE